MYPTQDEFHEMTTEFLVENHEGFIKKYTNRKWNIIYEKFFYKAVSLLFEIV